MSAQDTVLRKVRKIPAYDLSFVERLVPLNDRSAGGNRLKKVDGIDFEVSWQYYSATYIHRFVDYRTTSDGALVVTETPCSPYIISSYRLPDTNKVFAQEICCKFVTILPNGRIQDNLSGFLYSYYIDEDGDGSFETQLFDNNLQVPDWVKKAARQ